MTQRKKRFKKIVSIVLAIVIGVGTPLAVDMSGSYLRDKFDFNSVLSAYAADIVDTEGAVGIDTVSMEDNSQIIDLVNEDGSNTVYLFSEPISYKDEEGNLKTKDITVEEQIDEEMEEEGYDYTNGQNDYRIHFSTNSDKCLKVTFDNGSYSLKPRTLYSVQGREGVAKYLSDYFEVFEYPGLYGEGTNLRFYPQLNGVKDDIVLSENIGMSSFSFVLSTENCSAVKKEDGTICLISDTTGEEIQTFLSPYAYDSVYVEGDDDEHCGECEYQLETVTNNTYILSVQVDETWLNSGSTVYPVVIDPTTSNISNSQDTWGSKFKPTTKYSSERYMGIGYSPSYGLSRAVVQFAIPSAIKKGAVINSAHLWQRETGNRTGTSYVKPHLITTKWAEETVTWNNMPTTDDSIISLPEKNINGASYDSPESTSWYKFDIAKAVKIWVDGKRPNYGLMYISEHEADLSDYRWRSFATKEHATSSYRPYTVINYTNDTTAPTATYTSSLTADEWTKERVTLTIRNAVDNANGAGLSSSAYSFSDTLGVYNWQQNASKTFDSPGYIYLHVRDAAGNISQIGYEFIRIDKEAPGIGVVSGVPTEWTNQECTITITNQDSLSGTAAYSFSEEEGVYIWQEENSKTYAENATIYIYTKDKVGNVSEPHIVIVDKVDTTAPETPVVEITPDVCTTEYVTLSVVPNEGTNETLEYSFSTEEDTYDWQESAYKNFEENGTVYVYARDAVGNVSNPTVVSIDSIDKETYANIKITRQVETITNEDVVIIVEGAEGLEAGLSEQAYSFSSTQSEPGEWQASNQKAFVMNQTVYVFIKDANDKVVYIGKVDISNIDKIAPVIKSKEVIEDTKKYVRVEASDNESDALEYSYDNGETWTPKNTYDVPDNPPNSMIILVRDEAGNTSYTVLDFVQPEFYRDGDLIGLYNPVLNAGVGMQYKIGIDGEWKDYKVPFAIPAHQDTAVYARIKNAEVSTTYVPSGAKYGEFTSAGAEVGAYSETHTPFTFSYKGVSFEFVQSYNHEEGTWFLSTDSCIKTVEGTNDYVKRVILTDGSELTFVKVSDTTYRNEINGYELNALQENAGYTIEIDKQTYHYDENGKLEKLDNRYGHAITFSRSSEALTISNGEEGEASRVYTLILDTHGKVTEIKDPANGTITYTYDETGALVEVKDQAQVLVGQYDYTDGKLTKSLDKEIVYNEEGRVAEYRYLTGATVTFTYNKEANKFTATDAMNQTTSTTYNDAFMVVSETDEEGNKTEYAYDAYYRLASEKADGVTTSYVYDKRGNLISIITDDEETLYTYDEKNRVVRECTSENITYYVYNNLDEIVLSATLKEDYEGELPDVYDDTLTCFETIRYTYEDGLLIKVESDAETIEYEYDACGNQIRVTNTKTGSEQPEINETTYTYDKLGNVLSSSGEEETAYTYDAAGRVMLANENGKYTRTIYDNLGRVIQEIEPKDYDETKDGLKRDPATNTYDDVEAGHRYVYDAITGLLTSETDRLKKTTTYLYNDVGNKIEEIFDIYHFYYTEYGQIEKAKINGVVVVEYEYDDENKNYDRLLSETYANGDVIEYVYEDGELIKELRNGTEVVTYTYADGALSEKIDTEAGLVYKYGANNLVEVCRASDGTKLYSYTEEQQGEEAQEDAPIISTETYFGNGYTKESGETSVKYTFTDYNTSFVATKNEEDEKVVSDSVLYGGEEKLKASYVYDGEDRITEKQYSKGDLNFVNSYDEEDRITTHGYADTQWNYLYDEHSQLTRVNSNFDNGYTTLYNYDDRGNILSKKKYALTEGDITDEMAPTESKTFTYQAEGWKDLLIQVDDKTLTYDQNGNVLTYGDRNFTWERGRILSHITEGENTYTYTYDADGIRTSKTVNGTTTYYNTEDGVILSQSDGTNTMLFQYDSNGALAGFTYNGTQYYYITNQMGDVCGITDVSGNLIATYKYDEWGNLLVIETAETGNTQQQTIAEANPFRYRSYYYDVETGYYYLQSRYYDAEICRFINADDVKIAGATQSYGSCNLFMYCKNGPTNMIDLWGHEPISIVLGIGISVGNVVYGMACALLAVLGLGVAVVILTDKDFLDAASDVLRSGSKAMRDKSVTFVKAVDNAYAKAKTKAKKKNKEKHHIVAQKSKMAERSRQILKSKKIKVNDEINLVYIKYNLHRHLHTYTYYSAVEGILEASKKTTKKVKASLRFMKVCLLTYSAMTP